MLYITPCSNTTSNKMWVVVPCFTRYSMTKADQPTRPLRTRSQARGGNGTPKALKRNGDGSGILEDQGGSAEKRAKLAADPNVLVDRANAVAGPVPRADPQATLSDILAREQKWTGIRQACLASFPASQHQVDHANRELSKAIKDKTDWTRLYGPVPADGRYRPQGAALLAAAPRPAPMYHAPAPAVGGVGNGIVDALEAYRARMQVDNDNDSDDEFANLPLPVHDEDMQTFFQRAAEGDDFEGSSSLSTQPVSHLIIQPTFTTLAGNATVDEAVAKLDLKGQHDKIPNMTVKLMPHQLIGVAWMCEQEQTKNYGGILADEMVSAGRHAMLQLALATSRAHAVARFAGTRQDHPGHRSHGQE